jgi:hypothetical protein
MGLEHENMPQQDGFGILIPGEGEIVEVAIASPATATGAYSGFTRTRSDHGRMNAAHPLR